MKHLKMAISGLCAGCIVGFFGAGGGLVLVPLLDMFNHVDSDKLFPTSLSVMLPIVAVTLLYSISDISVTVTDLFPYLVGSTIGGFFACLCKDRISVLWLHRILGCFILWGGMRYLWK